MTDKDIITDKILERLRYIVQDNDLPRMSRNLRKVFFDYLRQQSAGLDIEFDIVLSDMESVIDLIELMADETIDRRRSLK